MGYKLFLDDERFPPNQDTDWLIVRTVAMAIVVLEQDGVPDYVSFDHDLGDGVRTGYDFAKYLCNFIADGRGEFPEGFDFYVHSQNPVGKMNIEMYMRQFMQFHQRSGK